VVKLDWRHTNLHSWLKVLDQLHHHAHINSWSKDKCGAFAQTHVGSQRVHKKEHVPLHLPVNTYDPLWLEGRKALYVKHVLCLKAEPYNFTHPSDVIVYVLFALGCGFFTQCAYPFLIDSWEFSHDPIWTSSYVVEALARSLKGLLL
jgi:hypothetical protein